MANAYVYDAIRTPRGRGKQNGTLHSVKPISLVNGLILETQRRNPGVDPADIEDVVLGVVSPIDEQGAVIAKTGGVLQYINGYEGGLAGFVARANELRHHYGDVFEVPESLAEKAWRGERYE